LTNEWQEVENQPLPDEEDEDFKWQVICMEIYILRKYISYKKWMSKSKKILKVWYNKSFLILLYEDSHVLIGK
jgi:hypothetical protein